MKLTVAQPNDHQNFLLIGCTFTLGGDIKTSFDRKPDVERHQFWQGLTTTLFVSNRRIQIDEAKGAITIERWLPITRDLGEGMFYDAMDEVEGGVVIARNAVLRFISQD